MTPRPNRPAPSGFTLVELSIVLVIIGLLAGSILVGRDLIAAAELRSFLRQIDAYNAAFMTFRLKFNCLPGDCPTASQFGLGTAGGLADNGDGNGGVDSPSFFEQASTTNSREKYNVWGHLSNAALVPGSYPGITTGAGHPASEASGGGYFPPSSYGTKTRVLFLTLVINPLDYPGLTFGNAFVTFRFASDGVGYDWPRPNFSAPQADAVDRKIDDAVPEAGRVRALMWNGDNAGSEFVLNSAGYSGCIRTTGIYDVLGLGYNGTSDTGNPWRVECILAIAASF